MVIKIKLVVDKTLLIRLQAVEVDAKNQTMAIKAATCTS